MGFSLSPTRVRCRWLWLLLPLLPLLVVGCGEPPWNNPYPPEQARANILYSSFDERPKHMDPARSYNANEYAFIAQVYEPPLQFHFLKRPYELVPLASDGMPQLTYLDADGRPLPADTPPQQVAFSDYLIRIRPGIRYQPHPALATGEKGGYRYHALSEAQLAGLHTLADFEHMGSRELVAADYVHQIKRLAFPRFHSPIVGLMGEHILGFSELSKRLGEVDKQLRDKTGEERPYLDLREFDLPGVQVVDRHSYRIRLKGVYPQFEYWLAMTFFAPMPWEADRFYAQPGLWDRNIQLDWYPIGTGPFMLTENNPNLRMVLTRNPNFHGEGYPAEGEPEDRAGGLLDDAGKPLPFVDAAVYSLEKENIPSWNKFLQGYYDSSGIGSDSFDQAVQFGAQGEVNLTEDMQEKGIRLATAVTTSIFYFGFNMQDPVVGGDSERARLLRRAIAIAVDYEEFVSIFLNGRGIAAQGPIPPGIFGNRDGEKGINPYVYELVDGRPRRKGLEEARRLLTEAGYPNGRDPATGQSLVLNYDVVATGPDSKALLNWWRKQFAKLGIQMVARTTDYNRFQDKMLKGTAQMFSWGWNADYPDPENFFFLLYGPNAKYKGGGENAANYENPEFDALFERMKNMPNGEQRQAVIDQMMEILRRDSPWLWGFHPKAFSLHHSWYHNVKPNLMANNTLKYKRVDADERAQKRIEWNQPVTWPLWLALVVLVFAVIPAVVVFRRHERSAAR